MKCRFVIAFSQEKLYQDCIAAGNVTQLGARVKLDLVYSQAADAREVFTVTRFRPGVLTHPNHPTSLYSQLTAFRQTFSLPVSAADTRRKKARS